LARGWEKIAQDGLIFSFKIHVSWANLQSVTTYRVATDQEKVRKKFFESGKIDILKKVREN